MPSDIVESIIGILAADARNIKQGSVHQISLERCANLPGGKGKISALVQENFELGSCTIALVTWVSKDLVDTSKLKPLDSSQESLPSAASRLTAQGSKLLKDLMLGQSSFLDFFNKNREKNKGWIRQEWFEHTGGGKTKRSLSSTERIVLSILICVGIRDGVPLFDLRMMWDISVNIYYGQKKKLREMYETFQSKQLRAPPVEKIMSTTPKLLRKQLQRMPPTPIFSPSTKPSSGKKARRKSTTPKKSNDFNTKNSEFHIATTTINQVDDIGNEAIETIHAVPAYEDASDKNIAIETHFSNVPSSPAVAKGIRRVTPTFNLLKSTTPQGKKLERAPPTPFFSPSTKPSSGKKPRRKSSTPKKSDELNANNSEFCVVTAITQVGHSGNEAIETTIDPIPVYDDTFDDNIIIDTISSDIPYSPAAKGIRSVTPTEDVSFNFETTAAKEIQGHKQSLLSRVLSVDEYPILTGGLERLDDIPLALEESMRHLGLQDVWKGIMEGQGKQATILRVPMRGGTKHFIEVPVSSTMNQFNVNARNRRWIELLLKTAGKDLSEDDVAAAIIIYLIKHHPNALPAVGNACKMPAFMLRKRMDPYTAAAMWHEANITISAQRVIKRYMFASFGFWISPAEKEIKEITKHFVRPIHGRAKLKEEIVPFWYRNVDEIVKNLLDNDWAGVEFNEIHVVFGGDHGQGVFGAAVKVILFDEDKGVVKYAVKKVGHIDCKKDTYEVLKKTIASPLNASLKILKDMTLCVPNQHRMSSPNNSYDSNTNGGDIEDLRSVSFVDPSEYEKGSDEMLYEIKVLAVGDLAFVAMALGKINMGGKWCYLCDLAPRDWKHIDHEVGEVMTLAAMEAIRTKISTTELADTPSNKKGCVAPPLLPVFEPADWIIPCLHVMMGAMNNAFVAWLKYVDERHENVPTEEMEARQTYWDACFTLQDMKDDFDSWSETQAALKLDLEKDFADCESKRGQKNVNTQNTKNKFFYSTEERGRLRLLANEMKKEIKQMKDARVVKEKMIKDQHHIVKDKKKSLDKIRAKRGAAESRVRQSIDGILKRSGVDRGASHGGDFTGVACLVLEDRIDKIMIDFERVLLVEGNGNCDEIKEHCQAFRLHFLLLSHMFSLARTTKKDFHIPEKKNAVMSQLREVIPLVDLSNY